MVLFYNNVEIQIINATKAQRHKDFTKKKTHVLVQLRSKILPHNLKQNLFN